MKLAIMQPYFFPYLGYFSLIKNTSFFVVFDNVQFIRHGWIDRNRILKPLDDWQYIKVPISKHNRETLIKDIKIKNDIDWVNRIISQVEHYKKKAPYYSVVVDILKQMERYKGESIVDVNINALSLVCNYLSIGFKYEISSNLKIDWSKITTPDDWALEISKYYNASEYYNPPGGKDIFDGNKYRENGVELKFLSINLVEYNQNREVFEPGLSIIDVMMFNSPEKIKEMLDNYNLE